jgi:hypothetical protein
MRVKMARRANWATRVTRAVWVASVESASFL